MAAYFDTPIKTNDQSVDRVLAAGLPVILIFSDGAPDRSLEQVMDNIAHQSAGKLLLAQVNVTENPATTLRYRITNTPSIVTFRNGVQFSSAESINAADLEAHAAYLLGSGPKPASRRASMGKNSGTSSSHRDNDTPSGKAADPIEVKDSTFEQKVLGSTIPVLVDFWAPWCGPCRMMEPILENIARESAGKIRVAKLNVDQNPITANRYGVRSIPTMMVVRNGQIIDQWAGALPEQLLRQRIAHIVNA